MANTALQFRSFSATDALRTAVLALQGAHIETASLDARLLLQHVLGVSREQLFTDGVSLNRQQHAAYQELIEKRLQRQPIAQLTGRREFWDLTFKVTGATLDPRPDSETLIEAVLEKFRDRNAELGIIDFGTGTGCLLLTLLSLYPNAQGTGVDICNTALDVAEANASELKLEKRAQFVKSRWNEKIHGVFDIIISNPPYIPTRTIATLAPEVRLYEPMLALDGGEDGFDCYRELIPQFAKLLAENGVALIEIGMGQLKEIESIVTSAGLRVTGVKEDLAGIPRCVMIMH